MRSLSDDVSSVNHQKQRVGYDQLLHQQHHEFSHPSSMLTTHTTSFSQSPSFLADLLSMPSPASTISWNSTDLDPFSRWVASHDFSSSSTSSTINHGCLLSRRQPQSQQGTHWESSPQHPPWLPQQGGESRHVYVDTLQEIVSNSPASWNQQLAVSSTAAVDLTKTSHSASRSSSRHTPLGSPSPTSWTSPTHLNSASSTIPSTPNSPLISGSFSIAAVEEDQSHHGTGSSSVGPSVLLPHPAVGHSGSTSDKRKSPDQAANESCDEIQSLDCNMP